MHVFLKIQDDMGFLNLAKVSFDFPNSDFDMVPQAFGELLMAAGNMETHGFFRLGEQQKAP